MTDPGLLEAIIAKPDDDLPRLMYADWLDEHDEPDRQCQRCDKGMYIFDVHRGRTFGRPCAACNATGVIRGNGNAERAEFIRLQITVANNSDWQGCNCYRNEVSVSMESLHHEDCAYIASLKRRSGNLARERELLDEWVPHENGKATRSYIWGHEGFPCSMVAHSVADKKFVRGFVEAITCSWDDWSNHAAAIRAATPLKRVRLKTQPVISVDRLTTFFSAIRPGVFIMGDYPGIEFELPQRVQFDDFPIGQEAGRYNAMQG